MSSAWTISLTTTSRRLSRVHRVIETLLAQSAPFQRIVLWVSEEPYLLDAGVLPSRIPAQLAALCSERFSIEWTRNLGPYRKLLPALARFGGTVVTADDDTLYPQDWLAGLAEMHRQTPGVVCCYRAHRMSIEHSRLGNYRQWPSYKDSAPSHACFPTGKDGVLYPAGALHEDVHDVDALLELAPTNDDIWFKAMAMRNDTRARSTAHHEGFPTLRLTALGGLFVRHNLASNNDMLRRVFERYELLPQRFIESDAYRADPATAGAG